MLGDILMFPLDKLVQYSFIREDLQPGVLVFPSEEAKEMYLPLFRESTAKIHEVSPRAGATLSYIQVLAFPFAKKLRINPISRNLIIPVSVLDELSSNRRKYYLCFLLVYGSTCIKFFRKFPMAYGLLVCNLKGHGACTQASLPSA
jgi:hypothetical protein